ncbi:MAG: hypothetical protein NWF04_04635 [Candidatus Bathyarchaeota archaeon]|nr:hypothetical protein [Candidatus Bathyarchaeota archaeon]
MLAEIGVVIAVVATVVTAVTVFWIGRKIKDVTQTARNAVEAQLLVDVLREYSADAMVNALQTLNNWVEEYKDAYIKEFGERYQRKDLSVMPINRARRVVLGYFQRVLQLYDGGYVSADFCNVICRMSGTKILFEVVEPFDEIASQIDPKQPHNKKVFDSLRIICKQPQT